MNINSFFNEKDLLTVTKVNQKKYINSFAEPKTDLERSFFQYKCQMKSLSFFKKIILNFVSILILFLDNFRKTKFDINKEKVNNLLLFVHNESNVPSIYRDDSYLMIEEVHNFLFDVKVNSFYKRIKRKYAFSFYFRLKMKRKLSFYNYLVEKYSPHNIITSNEYSFTSSLLTLFLEERNISHINVMHGEKLFYWRDSFFRFNKMYVWDSRYIDIFKELRTGTDDFEIYIPKERFCIDKLESKVDFTYYLQDENKKEMVQLRKVLDILNNKYIVAIRPHPRYTDLTTMNEVFNGYILEDLTEIPINESLGRTKNVISLYSTVLFQAYCSKIRYLIDDVTNENKFFKLKELGYILINDNNLLSTVLKEVN